MTKEELKTLFKNDLVRRRLEFIQNEAINSKVKDQATTMVMRVISNYASVGKDVSSPKALKINKNISEAAFNALNKSKKINEWVKLVTNEHQMPLNETWKTFIEGSRKNLTLEFIWEHFINNPMVTVLKSEDKKLNELGYKDKGLPDERYNAANIKRKILSSTPEMYWKDNQ